MEEKNLWVTDLEILQLHYANTLAYSVQRFDANCEKIVRMYNETLVRM